MTGSSNTNATKQTNEVFFRSRDVVPRAAYVHIPFCRHRCGYCNFTLIAGKDHLIDQYLDALTVEFQTVPASTPVDTIFVGGGTPTHLSLPQTQRLLELIQRHFVLEPDGEFSIEANPHDITTEKCQLLASQGVTRLSIGAQSFRLQKLHVLERDHDAKQIEACVALATEHFPTYSLDLIFGAPGETANQWRDDLQRAIDLAAPHVSTYGLTIEKGTTFWNRASRGNLAEIEEDIAAEMYLSAIEMLCNAGIEQYEVSNFARRNHRCRHNQSYWVGKPFFGLGAGAASLIDGTRATNHRSTTTYMKRVLNGQSPVGESETLSPEDAARERMVFGLRRIDGINLAEFQRQTGYSADQLAHHEINRYVDSGLMERSENDLKLTEKGLLISDSLWPDLL